MSKIRPVLIKEQIRLGSMNDGGYVIPLAALSASRNLVSLGYGFNSDFEEAFLKLHVSNSVRLYESDLGLSSLVRRFVESCFSFICNKKAYPVYRLKCLLRLLRLHLIRNLDYYHLKVVSEKHPISDKEISFWTLLDQIESPKETILKIDIEGSEYECLYSALKHSALQEFSSIIIEFHSVRKNLENFLELITTLQENYAISNIHINNYGEVVEGTPEVIEITFIRLNLTEKHLSYVNEIPHELDMPCDPARTEVRYSYL